MAGLIDRRRLCAGAAAAAGTGLAGLRAVAPGLAAAAGALAAGCAVPGRGSGRAEQVAPGVYALVGSPGEVSPANRGRIGNAGFVVGPRGVLLVDTGTSYRQGLALLDAVATVTPQPVVGALVTHARQEFIFGAPALRARGIPVSMQRQAAEVMTARCDGCLATLNRVLGAEEMRGTAMYRPDTLFDDSFIHDTTGRRLRVLSFGHSSGVGDIAVLDEASGVLFAGGLLDRRRIPDLQDADLAGWAGALDALRRLPLAAVVPGHGQVGDRSTIDEVDRYLRRLQQRLKQLVTDGAALSDIGRTATLPEFAAWDQYETVHRRNAAVLFVRLEREILFAPEGPVPGR